MPHTPNNELRDRIHAQVVKIINTYGFHESMRLNQPYKVLAVGNQELDEIVDMISSEIARAESEVWKKAGEEAQQFEMFLENVIQGLEMADGAEYKALRLALRSRLKPSHLFTSKITNDKETK